MTALVFTVIIVNVVGGAVLLWAAFILAGLDD